jgi:hypothetical protein
MNLSDRNKQASRRKKKKESFAIRRHEKKTFDRHGVFKNKKLLTFCVIVVFKMLMSKSSEIRKRFEGI